MLDTFGVEEEFMLVDSRTLAPVDLAGDAVAELKALPHRGDVTNEFLSSQVEYATSVCRSIEDARDEIHDFRSDLSVWARKHDLVALGSGTPFKTPEKPPVFPSERYERIAHDVGLLAREHLVNGMHVHVGVSNADEAVHVLNGLRPWLPLLLALSSNSPFWAGQDTAHHSWRSIQMRRWTTYGIPPYLHDSEEYEGLCTRLRGVGATTDYSANGWMIRLSAQFPTVEIRVCDTQLDPTSAVAMASILRALAHASADATSHQGKPVRLHVLDSELWHAARYGISNGVYDPVTDLHSAFPSALRSLHSVIEPHVRMQGSGDLIDEYVDRILVDGTGAARQRDARRLGHDDLVALYELTFLS